MLQHNTNEQRLISCSHWGLFHIKSSTESNCTLPKGQCYQLYLDALNLARSTIVYKDKV